MIPKNVQERLKSNWGDKADALNCNVECRVYDPTYPKTEWLIYAMNPDNDEELMTIECFMGEVECIPMSLISLNGFFNAGGEKMVVDEKYRPRQASVVFKQKRKERGFE